MGREAIIHKPAKALNYYTCIGYDLCLINSRVSLEFLNSVCLPVPHRITGNNQVLFFV